MQASELADRAAGFDVVGIDEAQFLGDGVVSCALELADRGTRVIVAGLDQDFRRLPFGPMPELLAHAEFVDKLQAVCHRGGPATTTLRLVDGRPAPYSGDTVVVGAAEQYEARCRGCHEPGIGAAGGSGGRAWRNRLCAAEGAPALRRRGPFRQPSCQRPRTTLVASATTYTAAATSTIVPPGGWSA